MPFEVRNPEVEAKLKEIGRAIKADMPEGFGFALLIFGYKGAPDGSMFYMSSADWGRKCILDFLSGWL